MSDVYQFFMGIDWATASYQICVLDAAGNKTDEWEVPHSGRGLQELLRRLCEKTGSTPEQVAFAIEMPTGAIVDTLLEHKYAGFHLNPKQMDRFRDRHTVAGAKDDSLDAYVIADSLRTDRHCFHPLQVEDPQIIRIRTLSRMEEDLGQEWSRLTSQLREQVHRYYPQMLDLSPAADEAWMWQLLQAAPLPARANQLKPKQVEKILRDFHIRRLTAPEVLQILRTPPLPVAPGMAEAASEACLLLILRLRLLLQQKRDVARRVQQVLSALMEDAERKEHRDVQVLYSVDGVGRIIAATMLAEAWPALAQRDYHALRSYAGVAPVTHQSGKRRKVVMRYGCNQRLRNALYHWARVSLQKDAHSRDHYHRLRNKGHSHGRALRGVADRLLAMLISMLRHGTDYDPSRRGRVLQVAACA
jgi:transposase